MDAQAVQDARRGAKDGRVVAQQTVAHAVQVVAAHVPDHAQGNVNSVAQTVVQRVPDVLPVKGHVEDALMDVQAVRTTVL